MWHALGQGIISEGKKLVLGLEGKDYKPCEDRSYVFFPNFDTKHLPHTPAQRNAPWYFNIKLLAFFNLYYMASASLSLLYASSPLISTAAYAVFNIL